jgi:hypothetical protein
MAAVALPAPGTEHGPCAEPCRHTDCAATRTMAARACIGCGQLIGYERRFFQEDTGDLIHLACWPPARGWAP